MERFGQETTDLTGDRVLALLQAATRCPLCWAVMIDTPSQPQSKELDHVLTLEEGGRHEAANVRVICRACNRRLADARRRPQARV